MLTTYNLYKKQGYQFEINDLVKFKLSKEYKLRTYQGDFKIGIVEKSSNKNSSQVITGAIMDYTPCERNDLEIELIRNDGYEISLKLSQCEDLRIL